MTQYQGSKGHSATSDDAQRMTHLNVNKLMATGMPVTCADLISRRDIPQRHTQWIDVNQHISKLSPAGMHRATAQQANNCCTRGMHKTVLPNAAF